MSDEVFSYTLDQLIKATKISQDRDPISSVDTITLILDQLKKYEMDLRSNQRDEIIERLRRLLVEIYSETNEGIGDILPQYVLTAFNRMNEKRAVLRPLIEKADRLVEQLKYDQAEYIYWAIVDSVPNNPDFKKEASYCLLVLCFFYLVRDRRWAKAMTQDYLFFQGSDEQILISEIIRLTEGDEIRDLNQENHEKTERFVQIVNQHQHLLNRTLIAHLHQKKEFFFH
jgi:hypothetical protein